MRFIKGNKYSAQRVDRNGISFASKLEAALYDHLWLREKAGEIRIEKIQDHVYLTDARICYIPDFKILNLSTNEFEWAEAKGFESQRWPIITKLWAHFGPGKLTVYKGSYKKLFIAEIINPKPIAQGDLLGRVNP